MGESFLQSVREGYSYEEEIVLGVDITYVSGSKATCVYTDGLAGKTPCTWTNNSIASSNEVLSLIRKVCDFKTCLIPAGSQSVYKYLNPDDWSKYKDGTSVGPSAMTSYNYNVFTEFPHFYHSITKNGNKTSIRISNVKKDSSYSDWLFSYNGTVRKSRYIGSFLGYNQSSKLYSIAGVSPTASFTMENFRTYAKAQGSNYDMWDVSSLNIITILYLLAFCNVDSQSAVCPGYTDGSAKQNTGGSGYTTGGDFYRTGTSNTSRFRIFGIEDVWGNVYQYMSNLYTNGTTLYVTDYNTANLSGNVLSSMTFGSSYGGWIADIVGTTYFPFVAREGYVNASDTTGFCDYGYVDSGYVARSGGYWNYGSNAGVFYVNVYNDGGAYSSLGSRLVKVSEEIYSAT